MPRTYRVSAPEASCPAPQVRAVRERPVHVPRTYSTEAPGRVCQPSATPAGVVSLELNIIPIRDKTESTNLPPAGVYSLSARAAACTAGLAGSCAAIGTTEARLGRS